MTGPDATGTEQNPTPHQQWLLTLFPAFPLLLLLLRLWYLSRQNLQTMLLLVQNVNPLGLVSTLLITLVWTLPLVVLVGRVLGTLFAVSVPEPGNIRASGLVRAGLRIPYWVAALATMVGLLTWQLRFLPLLVMMAVAAFGLELRRRHHNRPRLIRTICVAIPASVALTEYAITWPASLTALRTGQAGTTALLLLPPAMALLLTGPVPAWAAGRLTRWVAVVAIFIAPLVVGANFLRAPILPAVALETSTGQGGATQVTLGYVIAVNDRMTIVLDRRSTVHFFVNDDVRSEAICPDDGQIPVIPVTVHGWQVEQPMLAWLAPARRDTTTDPRCQGRPLRQR